MKGNRHTESGAGKQSVTPSPSHPFTLSELFWPWIVAIGTMLLTLVPYLIGWSMADERRYMWLGYNLDDSCVYLSWMRQAADGSYRALNLFTTEPQHGMALNPLFLVLGKFAGLTGLPLLAVYHGARMVFGVGLLLLVWQFLRLTVAQKQARQLAFLFVCFSSGLGWLPIPWETLPASPTCPPGPVDLWQPEAITFLTLYLSPLFVFSLGLQVAIFLLLFLGERTGRARYAVAAGVCGAILGLVHTYDVISVAAVWLAYLLVQSLLSRRASLLPTRNTGNLEPAQAGLAAQSGISMPFQPISASWLRALIAGILTAPAVAYIFFQLRTETVFRARANVATLSPSLTWVLLGYGLTLVFAILGIAALRHTSAGKASASDTPDSSPEPTAWTTHLSATRLLITWAIVNIAVSYLPRTPFQRKMLQGAHFPIAILAGIGAVWLLQKAKPKMASVSFPLAAFVLTLLLSLSNIRFLIRDIANDSVNIAQTLTHRPYLNPGEIQALEWIAKHTPPDTAIQPLLWRQPDKPGGMDATLACFTPGLIHRKVYCGHWGETPNYGDKVKEVLRLTSSHISEADRIALLRKMKVRYLIFSQKSPSDTYADDHMPMFRGLMPLPPYLTHVYPDAHRGEFNSDADIYEVNAEALSQGSASTR